MTTNNLMLVIRATNDAAKAPKSVEGHLQQIVLHPAPWIPDQVRNDGVDVVAVRPFDRLRANAGRVG